MRVMRGLGVTWETTKEYALALVFNYGLSNLRPTAATVQTVYDGNVVNLGLELLDLPLKWGS